MNIRRVFIRIVDIVAAIVALFLGLRIILKLFAADAGNGFVSWIYEMSGTLLDPFRGIFPTREFENNHVLEFSAIFALLAYGLAYILVVALVRLVTPEPVPAERRATP